MQILRLGINFILAIFVAFLPLDIREPKTRALHYDPVAISFINGLILTLTSFGYYAMFLYIHLTAFSGNLAEATAKSEQFASDTGNTVGFMMHSGTLGFLSFFFSFAGAITFYFFLCGLARLAAFFSSETSLGDPILAIIYSTFHSTTGSLASRSRISMAGSVELDEFIEGKDPSKWDFIIKSSRPKPDFKKSVPVKIDDDFYWMIEHYERVESATGKLRFYFKMKKLGQNEVIRAYVEHGHPTS